MASRPGLRSIRDLEPHQIDVIALALVAIGIFLGGVAYGFWAGGSLGHGILKALELLVGKLAYLTPIALVLGGARVLARDVDVAPATRPLRSGTICLLVALALAFAAGVFGPGRTPSSGVLVGACHGSAWRPPGRGRVLTSPAICSPRPAPTSSPSSC